MNRELDALVAERVMGWVWVTENNTSVLVNHDAPGLQLSQSLKPGKFGTPDYDARIVAGLALPCYSSNIEDAWTVVEKLISDDPRGLFIGIEPVGDGRWRCEMMRRGQVETRVVGIDKEISMAICGAILLFKGVVTVPS